MPVHRAMRQADVKAEDIVDLTDGSRLIGQGFARRTHVTWPVKVRNAGFVRSGIRKAAATPGRARTRSAHSSVRGQRVAFPISGNMRAIIMPQWEKKLTSASVNISPANQGER